MKANNTIIICIIAAVFFALAGCAEKAESPAEAPARIPIEQAPPPLPEGQTGPALTGAPAEAPVKPGTPSRPVGQAAPPPIEAPAAPSNTEVPMAQPAAAPQEGSEQAAPQPVPEVRMYRPIHMVRPETAPAATEAPVAAVKDREAPTPVEKSASSPVPDDQGSQQQESYNAIDQILSSLKRANIVFNTPRSMMLDETFHIRLLLNMDKDIEQLKQMINQKGEQQGENIRISDVMEARLSGSNFKITAIGSERQCISKKDGNSWNWDITPTEKGLQNLHLTMTAIINVNGKSQKYDIRTFDKVIDVKVVEPTLNDRVRSFIGKNWQWLWATLLVPVAGWLWKRIKGGKTKAA